MKTWMRVEVVVACLLVAGGCKEGSKQQKGSANETSAASAEAELRDWYAGFEKELEEVSKEAELAWWDASNSGKKEDFDRLEKAELRVKQLHSDPATYAKLEKLRESDAIRDPVLRRTLEVVFLEFQGNQIPRDLMKAIVSEETALARAFNTFRAEVDGKIVTANEIHQVLADSDDSDKRRQHWEASKAVGPLVAEPVVALVKKRNQVAVSLGYTNYYEMRLRLIEQDPEQIAAVFDELDRATLPIFTEVKTELDQRLAKRFRIEPDALRPWHYGDVFFQESQGTEGLDLDAGFAKQDPREICTRFFVGIGMPSVTEILGRSDLYGKEGKVEHAFCADIDRKGDVRILANLRNDEYWTETLLHELGHAVYDIYIDADLPFVLRRSAHALVTEGVAELFGSLTREPSWLAEFSDLPPESVDRVGKLALTDSRAQDLVFVRWSLVMFHFERGLYADPDQDLNALWWKLVERYQLLKPPDSLEGRADWAAKIHLISSPAYYHNYMLGTLFAAQLRHRLAEAVPEAVVDGRLHMAGHPKVGTFLIEQVFRPGFRYRWDELVQRATGAPLSAKAFVSDLQ